MDRKEANKETGFGQAVSNGDPINLTIDKTQVRKYSGEKKKISANHQLMD